METNSQWLLTALLNSLWLVAGIAAIALLSDRLLRGTAARFRHMLWVTALAASICLPVLTSSHISFSSFFSHTAPPVIAAAPTQTFSAAPDVQWSSPTSSSNLLAAPAPLPEPTRLRIGKVAAAWLLIIYSLFLLFRLTALLLAWLRTRALTRTAFSEELPSQIQTVVTRCKSVFAMRNIRIQFSPVVPVPIATGIFRPVIILPEQMLTETDSSILTSAIGHELVHIRRHDFALNLFYELVSLPISFHPAAISIRHRIKQTRELRCDEIVAEKLMDPGAYARSLVKLAGSAAPLGQTMRTISVGINDADILEERVMNMLRRPKLSARRRNLLVIAAAALFAVPCVAAAPYALHLTIDPGDPAISPSQDTGQSREQEEREKKASREKQETEAKYKEIVTPRAIYSPTAPYPEDARAKQIEGTVLLNVEIGPDGAVKGVTVVRPIYPALDESAMKTVRTWRFEPPMKDGKPVAMQRKVEVSFELSPGRKTERSESHRKEADESVVNQMSEFQAKRERLEKALDDIRKKQLEDSSDRLKMEQEKLENELQSLKRSLRDSEMAAEKVQQGWAIRENQQREKMSQEQREKMSQEMNGASAHMKSIALELDPRWRADLASKAKISMAQAIEIASKEQHGPVVECSLQGEGDQVFYRVVVLNDSVVTVKNTPDAAGNRTVSVNSHVPNTILINAIDGSVLKVERDPR